LIVLAAVVVYSNSLWNGFALDDVPLVRDNPQIESRADLPRLLLSPYWPREGEASGLYRPLTIISYALNRALAGGSPVWYHAGNVALHALASLLAWYAASRAGLQRGAALLAALLFAVHPLHTEAVANIVGRAELLAAVCVLAAWLLHTKAIDSATAGAGTGWSAASGFCYLLGLLSKENAILAPLLFLLDDRLRGGRRVRPYVAYGAALAIGLVLRTMALGGLRGAENIAFIDNPPAFYGVGVRLATAAWVQVKYAWLFVWPSKLSSDYSYDAIPNVQEALDPRLWAGLLWPVALAALAIWGCKHSRPVALGTAVWILFMIPGSNLLFPAGTLMAERLSYLPSLGGCLLIGWLAHVTASRVRSTDGLVIGVSLAILIALSLRTMWRNPVWKDNSTLALHDVRIMPRSAKLHAGAGIVLHDRGETADAEAAYRSALEIYPDYAQIHYNLGELLQRQSRSSEAVEHLIRAATLSPHNPRPFKALERLYRDDPDGPAGKRALEVLERSGGGR
jgi:tetratricopeptide (TPR) repeat protein